MDEINRLRVWIRDYGSEKQLAFISDLQVVLGLAERQVAWQEAAKQAVSRNESAWLPVESMPKSGKFLIGVWEGDLWQPRRRFQVYEATGFKERPVWSASYRTAEGEVWEIIGWMPKP